MSQVQQPQVHIHKHETNSLGTAGLIVSIVGLVFGGILCPIGFLMSLIAVFKKPRGMAIGGLVIGGLGSLIVLFVLLLFGAAIAAAIVGAQASLF
ncbi:hypothetical protein [Poriferisphaera sp. WC338]|uniref:hypothetical protein n=1 Tax=Poriferisphaera sp. WC338 TaxID=3425129 RepID=UPI003D81684F